MARKLTVNEVKERIKEIHGDLITMDETTYINTSTRCRFIDRDYGEWFATPQKILIGQGNPKRGHEKNAQTMRTRIIGIDTIKERLFSVHKDTVSIDESTYIDSQTPCRFIDTEYGEWFAAPNNVIHNKTRHPKRGEIIRIEKRKTPMEKLKQMIFNIHGTTVTIDEYTYKNIHTPARFIDSIYGEWWTCPSAVINQGCGHKTRGVKKNSERRTIPIDTIKNRIFEIHGDTVSIDESSYVNIDTRCRFIDKDLDEWYTVPAIIIYACAGHPGKKKIKCEETCMERYGCRSPMQDHNISLKSARSSNISCVLKHWKTEEEIICIASYEKAVAQYFNTNKIDYLWQPKTFHMTINEKKRTYRPDCYLPGQDLWIEIKGYFRELSKEKWEYFHNNIHTNSELWNKEKLKELGIP